MYAHDYSVRNLNKSSCMRQLYPSIKLCHDSSELFENNSSARNLHNYCSCLQTSTRPAMCTRGCLQTTTRSEPCTSSKMPRLPTRCSTFLRSVRVLFSGSHRPLWLTLISFMTRPLHIRPYTRHWSARENGGVGPPTSLDLAELVVSDYTVDCCTGKEMHYLRDRNGTRTWLSCLSGATWAPMVARE